MAGLRLVTPLHITGDKQADELISSDPLALLIGMVLDQQVPLEWAFAGPLELERRLGGKLDARRISAMDPDELSALFTKKPALHRYPGSMAKRVHELCSVVCERYDCNAERVWSDASSGTELFRRVRELPGFGEQKAKIFVALLGKQLGVRPPGWREVSVPYSDDGSTRSVADIVDTDSLARVRAFKQDMKQRSKQESIPQS